MMTLFRLFFVMCLATTGSVVASDQVLRLYRIEATGFSLNSDQQIDSYQRQGHATGSVGSILGIGTIGQDHPVSVQIEPLLKSDRFLVKVTLRSDATDENQTNAYDLTDLQPKSIEITTDDDSRTYHLNLAPKIEIHDLNPKPFSEAADDLYLMQFHGSRVVLNDNRYIGRMAATDADLLSLEVCDVATIEFSLHRLKNAKPWGTLNDGRLTLSNPDDGTIVEIGNVTNGSEERKVTGGPYQVWVRWQPPTSTSKEYRASLLDLSKRVEAGEFDGRPHMAATIEAELAREPGPWVLGSGARKASKLDLVE